MDVDGFWKLISSLVFINQWLESSHSKGVFCFLKLLTEHSCFNHFTQWINCVTLKCSYYREGRGEGDGVQKDSAFHTFDCACSLDHQLRPVQLGLLYVEVPSCIERSRRVYRVSDVSQDAKHIM